MSTQLNSEQQGELWARMALEPNRYWLKDYAVSMVGDPLVADDIAQRVLVTAWKNRNKYEMRKATDIPWTNAISRLHAVTSPPRVGARMGNQRKIEETEA